MSNPEYLTEVPSPLPAAPLVVRRKRLWQLRRCALRVLSRGAQADARGAPQVLDRGGQAVARGSFFRYLIVVPRPLPEKPFLLLHRGKVAHKPESLLDAGSAGREGRAYVMRVDDRAKVT
jgi:hypothetical protein